MTTSGFYWLAIFPIECMLVLGLVRLFFTMLGGENKMNELQAQLDAKRTELEAAKVATPRDEAAIATLQAEVKAAQEAVNQAK